MEVSRSTETGHWRVETTSLEREERPDYLNALPEYLNAFEPIFARAKVVDEFQFVVALLGIFGMQAEGWVPYETTLRGIKSAVDLHNTTDDWTAARHLKLWIYGHVVEASAPYDLLANGLLIARGETAKRTLFPDENGRPVGPGQKIRQISAWAQEDGHAAAARLFPEIWDRKFRNGIFHADYALHGLEVRLPAVGERRTRDEVEALAGKAQAYHEAVAGLRCFHIESYTEPKRISAASFSPDPDEEAIIVVREGEGAIGLKDAHSREELAAGAIRWHMLKLRPGEEQQLVATDPALDRLPP